MTDEISVLVQSIVADIDNSVPVKWDDVNMKWLTCNTKWARIGKIVTDEGGNKYKVTGVSVDEWLTLEPLGNMEIEDFVYLSEPFWITGTHVATNNEWTKKSNNLLEKTPITWLLETIKMRKYGRESTLDFSSDLRLFFLDETNVAQFYTADHRSNVVHPMERLALEFMKSVAHDKRYRTIEDYEVITFSRFGVERPEGMFQNVLDANLSGVELRVELVKYKENCKC